MEDLEEISDHVDEFNRRSQQVINKVHRVFSSTFSDVSIKLDKPKFYNSYYRQYLAKAKSELVKSVNSLSSQLQRLNLIPPVQVITYNWHTIDEALTKIENKINQY
ncbi:hypothetical protein LMB33_05470 [Limosilactobacillus reuteri]|uniref:hypothetical protein n=1 Tax=Limosilactobacillus reuteri TaxID=1598 RepID=UPI001E6227DE|nr:hypothetical protein [Limosilactobacillus reuteri]MCC4326071.1 hypothetical protein [Limosilactobacillus reuteri]MCC4329821.1 hypothetical protein [Limosilactobacillus reuteri]